MARLPNQKMTPGRPAKPPGLSKEAGQEWDRLIADLEASGIGVAKAHGRLIEQAAMIAVDLADAEKASKKDGPYYLNRNTGAVMLHPATRRLDSLRRDYVKVLSLLGLRSAVADGKTSGPSLEEFINS